jgi:hypothetical protein
MPTSPWWTNTGTSRDGVKYVLYRGWTLFATIDGYACAAESDRRRKAQVTSYVLTSVTLQVTMYTGERGYPTVGAFERPVNQSQEFRNALSKNAAKRR